MKPTKIARLGNCVECSEKYVAFRQIDLLWKMWKIRLTFPEPGDIITKLTATTSRQTAQNIDN
jgi:hypothetical protein